MTALGELKHALELSKPKFVFASEYAAKRTIAACKDLKFVQGVVVIADKKFGGSAVLLNDFVNEFKNNNFDVEKSASQKVEIKEQVALIVCSSGTTGQPKGVLITQENIMSVIQSYRDLFVLIKMLHGQTITNLNIAPWFHSLGFMSMILVATSRDAVFVFLPKFEEEVFLRAIEVSYIDSLRNNNNLTKHSSAARPTKSQL